MWDKNWRSNTRLDKTWDLVVVGGGIVGAGIMREAARLGLSVLLVEQRDFAWGTSSRSSKFVHGGLRYLKDLDFRLAYESVRGRRQLLNDGHGLVYSLDFLLTRHQGDKPGAIGYEVALTVYDLLAQHRSHRHYSIAQLKEIFPQIGENELIDSFSCAEAMTDDARLALRVLGEGMAAGGVAFNYVRAEKLLHENNQIVGVQLRDVIEDRATQVSTRVVVNATGAWVDQLRRQVVDSRVMRPLRGSHLVFPGSRLPVAQVLSLNHPIDKRPVTIAPWHSVTIVGSTDLDYHGSLDDEPHITPDEVAYLMAIVEYAFPKLNLTLNDVLTCYAGVRPVIDTGKADPSKESRDHMVLYDNGLLTVTGGKLTTFQTVAFDALQAIPRGRLNVVIHRNQPALEPIHIELDLPQPIQARLIARYGNDAAKVAAIARDDDLEFIPGTNVLWIELRWAARYEAVAHLDDLMLRRVALGILLPEGGKTFLPKIRAIVQNELSWDDARWEIEQSTYCELWKRCYSLPDHTLVPDWHELMKAHKRKI
jgi:glycerol-3-phosphate dehydrogenase